MDKTTEQREVPAREGEIASEGALSADATLCFIGRIETPWTTRADCPRQGDIDAGPECRLVLDPRWTEALLGIERHRHLQVLYWMHEARRDLVLLRPRGCDPGGPFALRAPTRPNPIASSIVTLLDCRGGVLIVRGLDCVFGTPLLDVKPWRQPPGGTLATQF